jgi:hypothetical protein
MTTVTGPVDINALGNAVMAKLMQAPGAFRVDVITLKTNVMITDSVRNQEIVGEHEVLITFDRAKVTDPMRVRILIDGQYYPTPPWVTDIVMQQAIQRAGFEAGMVLASDGGGSGSGGEPDLHDAFSDEPEYEQDPSAGAALAGTPMAKAFRK